MRLMLLWLIHAYRVGISPLLGPRCRFYPSCSAYAAQAIHRYGAWAGALMAARRLSRCHPFGGSGFDPVPLIFSRFKFYPCAIGQCVLPYRVAFWRVRVLTAQTG